MLLKHNLVRIGKGTRALVDRGNLGEEADHHP